ncbi:glycosyltransferase [Pleurocapsales cyanobacterium LEGE 10410]|nr:glycosyltransferase [Pleurocapsales cyanobacterium LEGE 10410]
MLPNNKRKIALISVHGDPAIDIGKEEAGGQNVYVRKVGEALARLDWSVDMFTRRSSQEQAEIVEHNYNCRTIRLTAGPQEFVRRQKIFEFLPEFVTAFLKFQREQQITYPLIHTNYWLSAWVGMELKKQQSCIHLHTYHSLGAVKYKSVKNIPEISQTRLEVEKECLESADLIVATSPQEQEHMRSLVSDKGNITVIPCGTDIANFGRHSRQDSRVKLNIEPEAKVVLYVGRFDPRKGIETLVRAVGLNEVKKQPHLKLIIVGGSTPGKKDGKEKARIESIVKELGLEEVVLFAGRIEHTELAYYYAAADVCVVPSHYEPFGLVAIEAMASGTPVIASRVGGLKFTVVDELTGLLVPPQDEQALAKAIARVLLYPAWSRQLEKDARKRVESMFSWDGVAEQLQQQYLEQLSEVEQESLLPTS